MARVVWTREALTSLHLIANYIDHFDPDAAQATFLKLRDAADGLCDFPGRGRPSTGATRELTIVPPYVIRYEVEGEQVRILNIRHGRQRPRE